MAQPSNILIETQEELDSRRMMAHINKNSAEKRAAEADSKKKQTKEIKKKRSLSIGRHTLRIIGSLVAAFVLYKACIAALISPMLAIPASYLLAMYFGWSWCKVMCFAQKGCDNE